MRFPRPIGQLTEAEIMVIAGIPREEIRQEGEAAVTLRLLNRGLLSQEPAAQLIRSTARQQWRLIVLNLGSSLVEAFTEGATLAVVLLIGVALSEWGEPGLASP
jgi:hypothetical protein